MLKPIRLTILALFFTALCFGPAGPPFARGAEASEADQCRYVIQIASGQDGGWIERQAIALQKRGMDVRWEKKVTRGADWYRIITGCFESPSRARKHIVTSGLSDRFPGSFVGRGVRAAQSPVREGPPPAEERPVAPTVRSASERPIAPEGKVACRYVIQIASSQDRGLIEEQAIALQKRGMDVLWEKKVTKGADWYRIITGCFESPSRARRHIATSGLSGTFPGSFVGRGIPAALTPRLVARPVVGEEPVAPAPETEAAPAAGVRCRYVIQISSSQNSVLVEKQAIALQKEGMDVRWEKKVTRGVDWYRIITGCFESPSRARKHIVTSGLSDRFPGSFVGRGLPVAPTPRVERPPEPPPAEPVEREPEEPLQPVPRVVEPEAPEIIVPEPPPEPKPAPVAKEPMPPSMEPTPKPEVVPEVEVEPTVVTPDEFIGPRPPRGLALRLGLGYAFINETETAEYSGMSPKLRVSRSLYPLVGLAYRFSDRFAVKADLHYDYYSSEHYRDTLTSSPEVDFAFHGFSATLSPVLYSREMWLGAMGEGRLMASAGIGYSWLESDLDFPVTEYGPTFGVELSMGIEWQRWGLELGYRLLRHDADVVKAGFDTGDENDILDLSGVYLQMSYSLGY